MAPSLAESANDARIARFLRDSFPYPYSPEDAEAFIAFAREENGRGEFYRAIVADGKAVGGIAVTRRAAVDKKSGGLGYWLAPAVWGRGVMTRAVREMCREAFAALDVVRIYAEPYAYNTGSRRVLEKCGFTLEGTLRQSVCKNGRMLDSCIYALLREEFEG